ncbi:hypothetical protein [Ornithinibacillus scapharcae]|uniref:hypothetical protein n=1 Tax=Ornithinibacillus scapharcae TaxID=1147159 RepID=UPI000225B2DE|nr:hypothetical protein [Ornithinibacillus scapharcae]
MAIKACHILANVYPQDMKSHLASVKIVDAETGEIVEDWSQTYTGLSYGVLCDHVKNRAYETARDKGFNQVNIFENNFPTETEVF